MELDKALEYVNQVEAGKRPRLDSGVWSSVEATLVENGYDREADVAHYEKMRAYRNEEYRAGLL